ncbi:MAG: M14 family metallocarboxypeptidase [Oscillospiraceae bacterium]|nr:M14 family metallocarboxypeptidase [Oscillospiraceae bacterium]
MKTIHALISLLLITVITGCANNTVPAEPTLQPVTITEQPEEKTVISRLSECNLMINLTPDQYTYEDLKYDIQELKNVCGEQISVEELCATSDGRIVYDVVLGDRQAENQVLIFGAMHAREYITSQVVMRQLCDSIDALNGYGGEYNGIPVNDLLNDVTVHFIPMSNPDGVTISQFGIDGILNENVKNNILSMGGQDYVQWKANANGVDLNRNFDAGWDEFVGSGVPSSDRYKGTSPGSEAEAAALIRLTQDCNIKRTISYHTCGALIYWYYKQEGNVLDESQIFAQRISNETGYPLDSDYTSVDAAGYKDWAVYKMGIPSITIEVGNENGQGIINPVPISNFNSIWERNKNVVYATVYNLKYE